MSNRHPDGQEAFDAVSRLFAAEYPLWKTLRGRLHSWDHETVLDDGRQQYHDRREGVEAASSARLDIEGESYAEGETREGMYSFWVEAHPWRVRVEREWERAPDGYYADPEDRAPDVVLFDGADWWGWKLAPPQLSAHIGSLGRPRALGHLASSALVLHEAGRNYSEGAENIRALVQPAGLLRAFEVTDADWADAAGRRAIRLDAHPRGDEPILWAPGFAVLGADHAEFFVDAKAGIVLAWTSWIANRRARTQSIKVLHVDEPLPAQTFDPSA